MIRTTVPALLFLGISACAAVDDGVEVADLRFGIGIGPMPQHHSGTVISDGTGNRSSFNESFESGPALAVTLTGVYGTLNPYGLLIGAEFRHITGEVAYQSLQTGGSTYSTRDLESTFGNRPKDINYVESSGVLLGGCGYALTPHLHFELLAFAGLSYIECDGLAIDSTNHLKSQRGGGNGSTYGIRTGSYWTASNNCQIGIEGEFFRTEADTMIGYDGSRHEGSIDNHGFSVRGVLGYRF